MSTETDVPRHPLLQRVTPRQWTLLDVALSVIFFLGGLATITVDRGAKGLAHHFAWLVVALCLASGPLALRRRYTMPVLFMVTVALTASTMLGQGFIGVPFVALPLYSVVVQNDRRTSLATLLGVEVLLLGALGVAALQGPIDAGSSFSIVVAGATWIVADSVRGRRAHQIGLALQVEQRRHQEAERAQNTLIEERLQIARELHDIIAHSLSVIAVQSAVGVTSSRTSPTRPESPWPLSKRRVARHWKNCVGWLESCVAETSKSPAAPRRYVSSISIDSSTICEHRDLRLRIRFTVGSWRCRPAWTSRCTGSSKRRSRTSGSTRGQRVPRWTSPLAIVNWKLTWSMTGASISNVAWREMTKTTLVRITGLWACVRGPGSFEVH